MNDQEIFNKVARHLLAQNKRALSSVGTCRYRTSDGSKCAVGCLITDEAYTASIEGFSVHEDEVEEIVRLSIGDFNPKLVQRLQGVHDGYPPDEWPQRLRIVALKFSLSTESLT